MKEIPIYLFLGFLDSGKTTFIQETLEDPRFDTNGKTLLIACEDGEVEYDVSKFRCKTDVVFVDDEENITMGFLRQLEKQYKPDRILIEYNGMWSIEKLGQCMPRGWLVYQTIMFADSTTFSMYINNMRMQTVEKLTVTETVIFNRCTDGTDKADLLKYVRMVNMQADVAYEYEDGSVEYDTPEMQVPYDMEKPEIEVPFDAFGIWYLDAMNNPSKYSGKTVTIDGMVYKTDQVDAGSFVFGRPAMTCCVEDIRFIGFICEGDVSALQNHQWVRIKAEMTTRSHAIYGGEGPALVLRELSRIAKPKDEVVQF